MNNKLAVVSGANRGIGFEICRQLAQKKITVLLTARDREKGGQATKALRDNELDVQFHELDVSQETSITRLVDFIEARYGKLDILINNAGIFIDNKISPLDINLSMIQDTFQTNLFGPIRLTQACIPLLRKSTSGRIINISSSLGSLNKMKGGYLAYRTSKAALNAITAIFASELAASNIRVNSMCPGWTKTDMGGKNAVKTVEEGADTAVWLATDENIASGNFYSDRNIMDW